MKAVYASTPSPYIPPISSRADSHVVRSSAMQHPSVFKYLSKSIYTYSNALFQCLAHSRIGLFVTPQILRVTRCALIRFDANASKHMLESELFKYSGSSHLTEVIDVIAPLLVKLLLDQSQAMGTYAPINEILNSEQENLNVWMAELLARMYVNIAKKIRSESAEKEVFPIMIADVIAYLCKITHGHMSQIKACRTMLDTMPDPEERLERTSRIFEPLIEEMLLLCFPKGSQEVPVSQVFDLHNYLWNKTKKDFAVNFYVLHDQLLEAILGGKRDVLLKLRGGESLIELAGVVREKALEQIPKLFLPDAEGNPSPLVLKMMKNFSTLLNKPNSDLEKWLEKQLTDVGKGRDVNIRYLWDFLGSYLESLLAHIFFHLSECSILHASITKCRRPDAIVDITLCLFSLFKHFVYDNRKVITERLLNHETARENPENDPVLLKVFSVYVSKMLAMIGLDKPEKLPVPNFLKNISNQYLHELVPKLLIKEYFAFSLPPKLTKG